ncbi:GNAT family N-acetyltransferase [Streptomyces flaveus]|uniref:N-acetyltransferase domain-containing protein n=1 Tax=Streptomyces flaveus TaxID=66370 RepID=A0A917QYW6_9ACTN|nr:GNAT family N-acetyltransferase [Streptomyces flaveus]GGK79335.1 hypothetical protein GCM10010094_45730 [Streptomyces flaveus]
MSETTPPYEVRGSGPVLLVIPGGAGHPMGLDGLVERLADRFTVVTYDPMGLSHGRLGEPVEDQRVEAWSDGARQVLDSVLPGSASAYVFGSSSGGIAALDLLTRHPDRVRHVVAHEPPSVTVLPNAARHWGMFEEVYEMYRAEGLQAAMVRLNAGLEDRAWEAPPSVGTSPTPASPSIPDNPMAVFVVHVLRQFTAYVPDFAALKPLSARLTLAGGHDSRGQLPHRTARMLAQRSGSDFVEFPGNHIGAVTHPVDFAERLAERLPPVTAPGVPLTTQGVQTRQAWPDDASAVAGVYVRSWQAAFAGLVPRHYLDAMDRSREEAEWKARIAEAQWPWTGVLVAETEAGIVGFASFGPSQETPATAEIGTLYAMPELWGTGIGKQLMRATLTTLGQANYTQATLWVLEDNERARRFYEAAGWRPDGAAVEDTTGGASLNKLRYRRLLG